MDSGVASLLHRLAQPCQDGLLVPSQNSSFLEELSHTMFLAEGSILDRSFPSWNGPTLTSLSVCRSSQNQPTNYVSQSWMFHSVFPG